MSEKLKSCPHPLCDQKPDMFHNPGHSQFHVACVSDTHIAKGETRRNEQEAAKAWNSGLVICEAVQ